MEGLRGINGGGASPPYSKGPYTWDQQVTFTGGLAGVNAHANVWYVDGNTGSAANDGKGWATAFALIQTAVTAASSGDTIFVESIKIGTGGSDPGNYTENIIIPPATDRLSIIGVNRGRTQGGLPQLKIGATTTSPVLTIRAPGCLIANLCINGAGGTGGGILLDDDSGSAETKSAFGTTIYGCYFKNCVGTTATNAATGGAIQWTALGGAWQTLIKGNRFYKNVGDIVMKGTSDGVVQDVVIEDNIFSGPTTSVDTNIYVAADGISGLIIRNNCFTCYPALNSGTNAECLTLGTGCIGVITGNDFGFTGKSFGATADNKVPTTMLMANNWQEAGSFQVLRT